MGHRSARRLVSLGIVAPLMLGAHGVIRMEGQPLTPQSPFGATSGSGVGMHTVEIRSYNLKPGTGERFHQLVVKESLPMLRRWKIDVVNHGPSLHSADSYLLIRAFSSLEERERSEDAFYGSDEWRQGPREAILSCIDSYTTVVLHVDRATLNGLRAIGAPKTASPDR